MHFVLILCKFLSLCKMNLFLGVIQSFVSMENFAESRSSLFWVIGGMIRSNVFRILYQLLAFSRNSLPPQSGLFRVRRMIMLFQPSIMTRELT